MIVTSRIVDYLRRTRVLSGRPLKNIPEEEFETINSSLPLLNLDDLIELAMAEIPDSRNTLVIELGSEFGTNGAGYLAEHKPHIQVMLINKRKWNGHKNRPHLFEQDRRFYEHDLRFSRGIDLLDEPDTKKMVEGIYCANGITNLTYHELEVTPENTNDFFKEKIDGRDVFLIGIQAPAELPFTIAQMYNRFNIQGIYLAPTALEKIKPNRFPWRIIQKNLGLSDQELQGYVQSTFDPKAIANDKKEIKNYPPKYNYENPMEYRIGQAIKLGIVAALAAEVSGKIYRINKTSNRRELQGKKTASIYNGTDQVVTAKR